MNIKRICIVGGGSSGWMTAALLSKHTDFDITLIESSNVPTIGVGESTIGHINRYLNLLELKDEEWMPYCKATYKTSIKFTNFREKKSAFHYPFGQYNFTDLPNGMADYFAWAAYDPKCRPEHFAEMFNSQTIMTDRNKMTRNENNELEGFNFATDTAYHMDAALFGDFLKKRYCSDINHIVDTVTEVNTDEHKNVKSLSTAKSGNLTADLFVDCTGFLALLIDKALKVPFKSFDGVLMNDRAIATQIPYIDPEKEMESVTNCTAIEAGWVWNIPLIHRIGTGYVYSSKFATKEEAEEQFRRHLASSDMVIGDKERAEKAEFKHIKIRHGIHEKTWVNNVVAVGLSAGFIEPLESTGLMLTHESALMLLKTLLLKDGRVNKIDIDGYNFGVQDSMESFRRFISQHYAHSSRCDTPYWKHVTNNITYSQELANYENSKIPSNSSLIDAAYRLLVTNEFTADMGGIPYILAGHGYKPLSKADILFSETKWAELTWENTKKLFENRKRRAIEACYKMKSHYQFLLDEIYECSYEDIMSGYYNKTNVATNVDGIKKDNVFVAKKEQQPVNLTNEQRTAVASFLAETKVS
jgi:flavin-dependent dehydrogenase